MQGISYSNTHNNAFQNLYILLSIPKNLNDGIVYNLKFKDMPGGFPKSDLLGVTVALIHVAAERSLAV